LGGFGHISVAFVTDWGCHPRRSKIALLAEKEIRFASLPGGLLRAVASSSKLDHPKNAFPHKPK